MATRTKNNGETEFDIDVSSGSSTETVVAAPSTSGNLRRCSVIVIDADAAGVVQLLEETSGTALGPKRTIPTGGGSVVFYDVVTLVANKAIRCSRSATMTLTGFAWGIEAGNVAVHIGGIE